MYCKSLLIDSYVQSYRFTLFSIPLCYCVLQLTGRRTSRNSACYLPLNRKHTPQTHPTYTHKFCSESRQNKGNALKSNIETIQELLQIEKIEVRKGKAKIRELDETTRQAELLVQELELARAHW